MKLSIVIVSWNTKDILSTCFASLERELACFTPGSTETLVVDNASRDGTQQYVRERFPWARLIENDHNVGFAAANNQAMAESRAEYILLLNPDTEVLPGGLTALVDFMDRTPDAGAAGSHLLNSDGSLQVSSWPAITLQRELWRMLHLDALWPYSEYPASTWTEAAPQVVDSVQGASVLVRKSALDHVGLFDTQYFMYTEEMDLWHRIRNAGWRIYWVPTSRVVHYGGQSTQQVASDMFLQLYRSKIQFVRKHDGPAAAGAYKAVLSLAALIRLGLAPLVIFRSDESACQYRALAGNYARLVRNIGTY